MEAASRGSLWKRAGRLAWWVLPPAFCLALYWNGLDIWFRDDDFVWLGLRFRVASWRDLWQALFTPTEHGTFRPLSERAYFLIFGSLFPLEALPFRLWAFLTQFANLALVASITRRLTGSRLAGLLAPVFWTANSNLATAMDWSSAYMQLLCGFFILLAFHFLLRHLETGRWRYYWLQWAVFLTGFLAMETNLVYPALASVYTLLCARRHFRRTLPLFVASLVFVVFHMSQVPKQAAGPYALHFDSALPGTLATYWHWAWEPRNLSALTGYPEWVGPAGVVLFSLTLLAFTLWSMRRRNWRPLVFLAWFVILLGPVLPLREHLSPYYLTLPTAGLGMLAACAVAAAWRAGTPWKVIGVAGSACYLLISVPGAWGAVRFDYERAQQTKALVFGVVRARQLHPRRAIVLTRLSNELFWSAVWDRAFEAAGVARVYLDQDSEAHLQPDVSRMELSAFILPDELLAEGLARDELAVYQVGGARLKNVTRLYRDSLRVPRGRAPRRVDVGIPLARYLLGPTWHADEGGRRWMPRRATLRLGGPRSASDRLHVYGYCPGLLLQPGPLAITVSADGVSLATVMITRSDAPFRFDFALPGELVGRPEMEIEVQVARTVSVAGRELGLVFGVFEVR